MIQMLKDLSQSLLISFPGVWVRVWVTAELSSPAFLLAFERRMKARLHSKQQQSINQLGSSYICCRYLFNAAQ